MHRFLAGALALVLLLSAGCSRSGSPSEPRKSGASSTCRYAGAVVDATYPKESDLEAILRVLVSLGWKQTNTGVHEVINGTLDGAVVSAVVSGGKTLLSVHILRSQNEADYPSENAEAEALLRRVKTPIEEAVGLPTLDSFVHRINRGCEG